METTYKNSNSKSANARLAELNNRFPKKQTAKLLGISLAKFNYALGLGIIIPGEWHHVGPFAKEINYYNAEEIMEQPDFLYFAATQTTNAVLKEAFNDLPESEKEEGREFVTQKIADLENPESTIDRIVSRMYGYNN